MAHRLGELTSYPHSNDAAPPQPRVIEGTLVERPPKREHDPQFRAIYGHEHPNPAYAKLDIPTTPPPEDCSTPRAQVEYGFPPLRRRLMDWIGSTAATAITDVPTAHQALDDEIAAARAAVDQILTPASDDTDLLLFRQTQHAYARPWGQD